MSEAKSDHLDVQIAGSRVTIAGRIDESSPMRGLAARLPPGPVTIDAGGITFVNSAGLREWLHLVRAISARGTLTLERVSDPLMTQMNLIAEFSGRVRIASFHAQYACPACGAESAPLVDAVVHALAVAALRAPSMRCPECGGATELVDFPERYLSIFHGK